MLARFWPIYLADRPPRALLTIAVCYIIDWRLGMYLELEDIFILRNLRRSGSRAARSYCLYLLMRRGRRSPGIDPVLIPSTRRNLHSLSDEEALIDFRFVSLLLFEE